MDNGEWHQTTPSFIHVECWGALADNVIQTLNKGDSVLIKGELRLDEVKKADPVTGEEKSTIYTKVVAKAIGPSLRHQVCRVRKARGNFQETDGNRLQELDERIENAQKILERLEGDIEQKRKQGAPVLAGAAGVRMPSRAVPSGAAAPTDDDAPF